MNKLLLPLLATSLLLPTSISVDAASKATVVTKYAHDKKNLKYPYVSKGLTTSVRKTINADLTGYSKFLYQTYLDTEAFEKQEKKKDYCKELPATCNFTFDSSYKRVGDNASYLSFTVQNHTYLGGAHGSTYKFGVNYSLKTGKEIRITSVLKTSTQMKKVERYIYDRLKNNENYFVDHLSDIDVSSTSEFYFTKNGMKVIFQEYAIAPYVMGQPEIYVPKSVYQ
ncbi:DUF3298 domain-containing protein [Exiguobacterium indicum]|uniref:DUF3298 domain-containing protein n=1 Tax=Exiguobacterium indicum TaxID=296995 RepID=A0A0V8GI78_9BACL|nr:MULTISPECIES: DUF3298 and DUF4163 domain-containing protein [Exiguobacterium]KSU49941.1 hypothetical protein AS033_00820 [Exiguobacterium enclense]SDB86679.1 protein of unknown function [Exiguobacterium enclense]